MPRSARIVAPGYFYHITQRGNNRQKIFFDEKDRLYYLKLIEHYSIKLNVEIFAFCLMSNHVHFVVRPDVDDGLARTFRCAHMRYAQYFNKKYRKCGHIWQGRYFSCLLDEAYLKSVIRYVECNPVRAKLVSHAWDWPWSSAACHVGISESLIKLADVKEYVGVNSWEYYLENADKPDVTLSIRNSTQVGRVLVSEKTLSDLEAQLNRKLEKRRPGRPKKSQE